MIPPSFLDLPSRSAKPRTVGLTHILDKGSAVSDMSGVLDTVADYVDIWKFGWGTAYLDPTLPAKLALLSRHSVSACLGGTLLEIAWAQHRADECLAWAQDVGFSTVEVSRGVAAMTVAEKQALIHQAARTFTVLAEVGRKDAQEDLSERQWADETVGDRAAGATWIIAEGRESGSVGLYRPDGGVRANIVAAVVRAAGADALLFEAPRRQQQTWFVHEFGSEVNLANVPTADALAVETLRLGLRADTFGMSQQWLPT